MDVCDAVRRAPVVCAALAVLSAVGCGTKGPTLYPVRGQVVFDGKPAAGATLVFHPAAGDSKSADRPPTPTRTVQADGSFTLATYPYGDGAPAGEYRVAIVWLDRSKAGSDASIPNRLPARYGNADTSGLKATVNAGPTDLQPFQLAK